MELTEQCLPISVYEARAMGLIDDVILHDDLGDSPFGRFREQITGIAENLARSPRYGTWLAQKQAMRNEDERLKPLQHYRSEELAEMKKNFWGKDRSYHLARAASFANSRAPATCKVTRASKPSVAMNTVRERDMPRRTAMPVHTRAGRGAEPGGAPRSSYLLTPIGSSWIGRGKTPPQRPLAKQIVVRPPL